MSSPAASHSLSLPTIQIFLPETQLDNPAVESKEASVTIQQSTTDRGQLSAHSGSGQSSAVGKKRKKTGKNEGGGENLRRNRRLGCDAKTSRQDDDGRTSPIHPLQDYLRPGLDVVFCGINPGRMSAETGHHFANPTNHFWRCLDRSGMTTTLLPPSKDFYLLERFNIGLTNLVDRPSAQACELSRAEMVASVPAYLDKLARYRPRFVCFVGMVIWETVRKSLEKMVQQSAIKRTEKGKGREKGRMGLQTYKLVYGNTRASLPRETLLFVVPCTSGRVVQYQLPDKIALFAELRTLVRMPPSEIDTSKMESVVLQSTLS